ncbi:MAG TPA: hypothetical protein VNJ06_13870 [Gemmatimonadales bacterium]|nr:hypothetical protein [Gemmatimonadales bacterium]
MRSLTLRLGLTATALVTARLNAQDEGCGDTMYPTPLPRPSALVDSTQAVAGLVVFAVAKPRFFSLVFKPGDSLPHIRALDQGDSAAAVTLSSYVRRQRPADLWAIRVRIVGGEAPALTLERSTYCPPVPRTPVSDRAVMVTPRITPRQATAQALRWTVVQAEALVAADGRVIRARLTPPSGTTADYRVLSDLRRQHYQPALLDGEPIEGVYRTGGASPRP